jgi:hypothetical protein
MATNPPIVIGSFDNVPAPGSGVRSDWAQEISQYVSDHVGEIFYSQIVAAVNIAATTQAGANAVITPGNVNYDGKPIMLEFFSGNITTPAAVQLIINLWDGAVDLGFWGQFINPAAGSALAVPARLTRRLTPSAGVHNYNVRAWITSGATPGKVEASPPHQPAFLRASRI